MKHYYIENDEVKLHLDETSIPQQGSWDEVWADALKIILKAKEYDETHNKVPRGKRNIK